MQRKRKKKQEKDRFRTTCIALTKEQVDFLNDISKCCGCSGGKKLSRTAIIRVLIGVLMLEELDVMVTTIKSKEQLKENLLRSFANANNFFQGVNSNEPKNAA